MMTKPAFTKGPWHIDGEGGIRAGQRLVARYPNHPENRVNWDNDAHLIAAAPKMYAALARVVAANASFRATMPRDWDGDPLQDACAEAEAALAEADGRS